MKPHKPPRTNQPGENSMQNTSNPVPPLQTPVTRKPLLAAAMSLLLPGFGQLYNGDVNRAITLFLSFALLSVPGVAAVALYLPAALMMPFVTLGLVATLGVWLYGIYQAWQQAKNSADHNTPQSRLPGGVYVLVFLLCNALALPLLINYVRETQVASFCIPSTSMEPSVLHGDVLFADKRYNCPGCATAVQRGDIAIFVYPNNRTQNYIKRVIGLPGDRVQIKGHEVWLNGKSLTVQSIDTSTGLLVTEQAAPQSGQSAGPSWQVQWLQGDGKDKQTLDIDLTVPPGYAFVLGDNRSTSQDTRNFGPVPLQDIVGKARQIWFSKEPGGSVRWSRLGALVK
jgi:signal peptidase I